MDLLKKLSSILEKKDKSESFTSCLHDNSNTFQNQLRFVFQRSNYLRYQEFFLKEQHNFQMMFASFNSNTAGASIGAGTAYRCGVDTRLCWVRLTQSFLSCVVFCRSLFVMFAFFFSPQSYLYCLTFFDIRLLITSSVSSNFSLICFGKRSP